MGGGSKDLGIFDSPVYCRDMGRFGKVTVLGWNCMGSIRE